MKCLHNKANLTLTLSSLTLIFSLQHIFKRLSHAADDQGAEMSPEILGFAERLQAGNQSAQEQAQLPASPLTAFKRGTLHRLSPLSR